CYKRSCSVCLIFFFQAEDGIRDFHVTGVQTCALPICKLKKGSKVEVTDKAGKKTDYEAKHIILATGGRSRELPAMKIDGKKIIGYREALMLDTIPKKLLVVGSGAIGVEFAYFYQSIGSEVTIVEFLPRIVPVEDEEVSKALEKS